MIPHPTAGPPAGKCTPEDLRARFNLHDYRILLAFGFIHVDKGLDDLIRALGISITRRPMISAPYGSSWLARYGPGTGRSGLLSYVTVCT